MTEHLPAAPRTGRTAARLPQPPRLQLATYVDEPPVGDEWIHEIKFDGYRLAATLHRGRARLTTRNLLDWTERFAHVAEAVAQLPAGSAVLDGEVVALGSDNRSDFGALQRWLGANTSNGVSGVDLSRYTIVYQVFDLLHLDGSDLRSSPLERRKELLRELLARAEPALARESGSGGRSSAASSSPQTVVRHTDHLTSSGPDVYRAACRLGLEGVVSKRLGSPYTEGRGSDWLKSTCLATGDFVVGGFTDPQSSRAGFGALLLGEWADGVLRYVGKVGTGFSDALLASLTRRLERSRRADSPFATDVPRLVVRAGVTWVDPELVVEIGHAGRTHGGLLRQARFRGLREDKDTSEVASPTGTRAAPKEPRMSTGSTRSKRSTSTTRSTQDRDAAKVADVAISNPDRVLYPDQGVTKLDLARYYAAVGEQLLAWAANRPLSLVRCPEGSEAQCFYQKHPGPAFAASLPRVPIEESEGVEDYLYLKTVSDLVALVQAGVLEVHAWGSTVEDLERPDMLVFDLDPSDGVAFTYTKSVATDLRDVLAGLGLTGFLRTTGGKGLHVVVPLTPDSDWDTAKEFAKTVAQGLADRDPRRLTTAMAKAKRVDKVFIDYLRNGRGATAIVNYSTRSRLGAPVATPLRWDELARLTSSAAYDIVSVRRRLASLKSDPWEGFDEARKPLSSAIAREVPT